MALPTQPEIRPVLLEVLASLGGRARPADIYPVVTARFHIEPVDLATPLSNGRGSLWQNRIQFVRQSLVVEGLIDPAERGVWRLTDAGLHASRVRPAAVAQEADGDEHISLADSDKQPVRIDDVPAELRAAAIDSVNPSRLEEACAAAFRLLGFDAEVIGGPGNTDVVVTAPLGVHQFTVVVDAKSTARGRVADAQVDWLSIKQHRDRLKADHACIVGPSFGGGHLTERATEFAIVLLSVEELNELLELHSEAPFALTELRPLFLAAPLARSVLPRLRAVARDRRRLQFLVERVLGLIENFNRVQPDLVVAKPETLQALALASAEEGLRGTTIEEVSRVLALLEAAGVLSALPGGGFASTTSVAGAHRRLQSLVPKLGP